MSKKQKIRSGLIFVSLIIVFLVGSILTANPHKAHGDIQEVMRDAVLHETGQIRIFGDFTVNPGLVSAFAVTSILFVFALCIRLFLIPKFKMVPGRFQMLLEQLVGLLDGLTKGNSPHRNKFLGGYVFTVAVYIFVSTIFDILEATGANTVKELLRDVPGRVPAVLKALQKVDFETAKMIVTLWGQFVQIGASNIIELVRQRITPDNNE